MIGFPIVDLIISDISGIRISDEVHRYQEESEALVDCVSYTYVEACEDYDYIDE